MVLFPEPIVEITEDEVNNNNVWPNDERPADYDEVIAKTDTREWYSGPVIVFPIMSWMRAAHNIGRITGRFPEAYRDDLDEYCKNNTQIVHQLAPYLPCHIRVNNVSLKSGRHGIAKYGNVTQIFESIISSRQGHAPIKDNTSDLFVYPIPWVDIVEEYRVFVHNGNIVAISLQEYWNKYKGDLRDIERLIIFCRENMCRTLKTNSFTMDVAILADKKIYIIEYNSYFAPYAAGSAIYNWVTDDRILTGDGSTVHFRHLA